ncbi:MAG: hypothetical protein J4F41_09945, partial [Alphaproteobacteria bacterium]|nr:hypothetical protein [Alphaproteobacteria bacterium]
MASDGGDTISNFRLGRDTLVLADMASTTGDNERVRFFDDFIDDQDAPAVILSTDSENRVTSLKFQFGLGATSTLTINFDTRNNKGDLFDLDDDLDGIGVTNGVLARDSYGFIDDLLDGVVIIGGVDDVP